MKQSCVSQEIYQNVSSRTLEDYKHIEEALKGNEAAFTLLREKHYSSVHNVTHKIISKTMGKTEVVEDLTQEVFAKAFKKLGKFDFRGAFSSWLLAIAYNSAIDFVRQRHIVSESLDDKEYIPASDFTDTAIYRKERRQRVREAIVSLRPPINQVIYLRYYEDYPYDRIATTLSLRLNTVKAYLSKGKKILAKVLREEWEE
jgi:RNA polymerase sigma-70 factor, ECF subfamily